MMTKKRIYIFLVVASLLVVLAWLTGLATLNREELIEYIMAGLMRPYLSAVLKEKLITASHFRTISLLIYLSLLFASLAGVLLIRYQSVVLTIIGKAGRNLRFFCLRITKELKTGGRPEKTILLFVILLTMARWLYYVVNTHLQYDEIWYYNYYTSKPIFLNLFTFSTYPLHQLFTHFYQWLPFGVKVNLRLPGLVAGIGSFLLLYGCIRRITQSFVIAISAASLFISLPYCTANMVIAKGVMEEIFFAALAFFSLVFYTRSGAKKYVVLYAIAQAAGIYAAPTQIVFLFITMIFGVFYLSGTKKNAIKPLLLANLSALLLSLLAYAPMAPSAFFAVAEGSANKAGSSASDILSLTGLYYGDSRYALAILFLLAALFLPVRSGIKNPKVFLWVYALLLALSPLLVFALLGINLHPRTFAFIALVPPACIFMIFSGLTDRVPTTAIAVMGLSIFIAATVASHFNQFRFWSANEDAKAVTLSKVLMQNNISECYDNAPASSFHYYYPALEFYYGQQNRVIQLRVADPKSQRHEAFDPGKLYPCIVDSMNAGNGTYISRYTIIYSDSAANIEVLKLK